MMWRENTTLWSGMILKNLSYGGGDLGIRSMLTWILHSRGNGFGDIWRKKTGYADRLFSLGGTYLWTGGMTVRFRDHMGEACGEKFWCNGSTFNNVSLGNWGEETGLFFGKMIGLGMTLRRRFLRIFNIVQSKMMVVEAAYRAANDRIVWQSMFVGTWMIGKLMNLRNQWSCWPNRLCQTEMIRSYEKLIKMAIFLLSHTIITYAEKRMRLVLIFQQIKFGKPRLLLAFLFSLERLAGRKY